MQVDDAQPVKLYFILTMTAEEIVTDEDNKTCLSF